MASVAWGRKPNTIAKLATGVFDKGRRGEPKPGCDCVQCFGYCLDSRFEATREARQKAEETCETKTTTS